MPRLSTLRCALIATSLFATSASAAELWATTQDSFGNARAIQYDLATGNIAQGVRLDFNLSGADSPIAWARMGAIAFRDDPTAAVPEPATWLMMILGFAAVGMTARRRGGRGLTAAQA